MALPLNKCYPDGRPYSRPETIEEAIDGLLTENTETLCWRAAISDREQPLYIATECLVYLIRNARRRGDDATVNALLPSLFKRCYSNLRSKISEDIPDAETIREEILGQFAELFATDGTGSNPHELDFFEVRFNRAFQSFRIDYLRKEKRKLELQPTVRPFDEGDDGEPVCDSRLKEYFQTQPTQHGDVQLQELKEAINRLPPDERKAVVLCHMMGYDEESKNPNKRTAATICGVTGRTIRNRLARAEERLSLFKETIQ